MTGFDPVIFMSAGKYRDLRPLKIPYDRHKNSKCVEKGTFP